MLLKMSFSDAISINEDERIYTSEYLSEYASVSVPYWYATKNTGLCLLL